jgi:chromosomal replication initiator protein
MSNYDELLDRIEELENIIQSIKEIPFEPKKKNINQIIIDPKKTFENFIAGDASKMAKTASEEIALNPGQDGKYPTLYLYSETGLGKTHLLHAIANELSIKQSNLKVCAVTSKHLMDDLIALVQKNRFNDFVHKYTENVDVLMIDDVQEFRDKKGTQDQVFHIFNELQNKGKQLVFTADKSPKELIGMSERIKSRFVGGLVIDIQKPDLETSFNMIKNMCLILNIKIEANLYPLIIEGMELNPRNIEGYLTVLKATSEMLKRKIDKEFLKEQMLLF